MDGISDSSSDAGSGFGGGGLRAEAQAQDQNEDQAEAQPFEKALDTFLSYNPGFVREPLKNQFSSLLTRLSDSSLMKLSGISSLLYLLEPLSSVMAIFFGIPCGVLWSLLLWPLRVIGIPLKIPVDLAAMLISSCFEPFVKGNSAILQSIEQLASAVQDLFLSPVSPAMALSDFVRKLLYGNPLTSLTALLSLPLKIPRCLLAIPLWPLKAGATLLEICAIALMLPIRILLIPMLMALNLLTFPFRALGYAGSAAILYMLEIVAPGEVRTALADLTTLPQRIRSSLELTLLRLLILPFHYIVELLRSMAKGLPGA